VTSRRLTTLAAALGFLQLPPRAPELRLLHRWLDSWTGIGLIAVGLHRQGWDLQLTQYVDGNWRATFYVTGAAHSIVGGSAWGYVSQSENVARLRVLAPDGPGVSPRPPTR
jgi:hypothetical protein